MIFVLKVTVIFLWSKHLANAIYQNCSEATPFCDFKTHLLHVAEAAHTV